MGSTHAPAENALSQLAKLVSENASGELIAATDGVEVHLYLQNGRLAWATTTENRFIFKQKLIDDFHVDPAVLNKIVEDCHRTKKRLGETLIASGLLTKEQVHDALRTQVFEAIQSLERSGAQQALFLARAGTYAGYDPSLTFALDSLVTPVAAPQEQGPTAIEAVAKLIKAIPDLSWAAVYGPEGRTAPVRSKPPRLLPSFATQLAGGVEFIAVRHREGAFMGAAIAAEPGRSLWCGLPQKSPLSTAVNTISALTGLKTKRFRRPTDANFDETGRTQLPTAQIPEFLQKAGSEGLVLLDPTSPSRVWAMARKPNSPAELVQTAARRQAVLDLCRVELGGSDLPPNSRGPAFLCALVADSRWWWFGTDLPFAKSDTVWLALSRNADTLMGWALLESVARSLSSPPQPGGA